jgi:NADH:ubiquinone oxidoreductase subunit F (NADH-binding)
VKGVNVDTEDKKDCNKMETTEKTEEVGNLQQALETLEPAKVVHTRMAMKSRGRGR